MSYTTRSGAEILNPGAYDAAVAARIKANAVTGKRKRWLAEDTSRAALLEALSLERHGPAHPGDGDATWPVCSDDYDSEHEAAHKAWCEAHKRHRPDPFLCKMWDAAEEWGSLTPGQEQAARKALARKVEKDAEWEAKRAEAHAAKVAGSEHIGTVGERRDFTLCVASVWTNEEYGFDIVTFEDAGSVLVYKGCSFNARKGDTFRFKATITEHGEWKGVKQTTLKRPAKVEKVGI